MSDAITDVLADLPDAIALYTAVKAGVAALPKPPTVTDYVTLFNSIDVQLAALVEKIIAQTKS